MRIGVWIKAGPQPLFPAEPGELYQPFRIDSDAVLHMNLIHWIRFGSCEVRRLNRALVPIDAVNKISYFLTYHSFLFYISKLLYVTVILYFLPSFSFSPSKMFVFQTELSGKYIVLVLIFLLFYFFSSLRRGDQSTVFCTVSFDFNWSRSPFCIGLSLWSCRY